MNEQLSFEEIERLSQIALDAGDFGQIDDILQPLLAEDDKTRSASENLFLHRMLGSMYHGQGQSSESLNAYEKAYADDPRDYETLLALVEAELSKTPSEADSNRLMEILIFHRPILKDSLVMRIFKLIGDAHVEKGAHNKARECYEKALDACPGDMELINAMLKVSEASGDEQAIAKAREKLLNSMTAPESRAAILVSIGDDYLANKHDEAQALAMYEEALEECDESIAAHQRIMVLAERAEDWERCLHALGCLVKYSTEIDHKAKYLLKTAHIYKEKLHNLKMTIQYLNEILDMLPEKIDIFHTIIAMLQSQQDYVGIEHQTELMLKRAQAIRPLNVNFVATIAKKLGDVRLKQLKNARGAADAYKIASDLYPDNVNFHIVLAKLYAQSDDTVREAIHENREILRLAPDKLEAVVELAKCYRRTEDYDTSLCIYRVLDVLGMNDETGKAIVQKFSDSELPTIDTTFTDDIWQLIYPQTLDMKLVKILKLAAPALSECFANDLTKTYGIKAKDSMINLDEQTVFSESLRAETKALGFAKMPAAYRCDKFKGVTNAYLAEPSLVVHPNMLAGRTPRELAFVTAKAQLLMRPEYYVLQLGTRALDLIFKTIFKVACPAIKIALVESQQIVAKKLIQHLSEADRKTLTSLVEELLKTNTPPNIRLFMESVEDLGNRIGLIFCDDPHVLETMLAEEARSLSGRSIRDRIGSLLVWCLSENYAELRRKLGITLQV